ncbi:hypothetical protein ACFPRL_23595 [Pseudoclavibacter helvolus]
MLNQSDALSRICRSKLRSSLAMASRGNTASVAPRFQAGFTKMFSSCWSTRSFSCVCERVACALLMTITSPTRGCSR